MRLISIFDLQKARRIGAFDCRKLNDIFGKESLDKLYGITDEHEQIKVHLVAIGCVTEYSQVDVLYHVSLALVDAHEEKSLYPTVITHLHSKTLASFGQKRGQATLALQFHHVFSIFMGAGSKIFCTVEQGNDELVGECGFYLNRGYKKCENGYIDHVSSFAEGSGLELWFSDEFPSSHKENVHIFFSQKEYKSKIYAFNGNLLNTARLSLPRNIRSVLPKGLLVKGTVVHPSSEKNYVSNNFKDVKERADEKLLSMRPTVNCDSEKSPCLDRLVRILSKSNSLCFVEYFHNLVDYSKKTDLMLASFSKMKTYILHSCDVSENNIFMSLHKTLFGQPENSPRLEGTPDTLKMVLLVHASKLLAIDDLYINTNTDDDIHALGSDMSVISAITYSCDEANGVNLHSNYKNECNYGRYVSSVNQYLLRAILLHSGEDSDPSEKIAHFDKSRYLKDDYSAPKIYEEYTKDDNIAAVLDEINDFDLNDLYENKDSFKDFVKGGPSKTKDKEKKAYSSKISRLSKQWGYTAVKPIEFNPGVIVTKSFQDKSELSVSLSLLMELFYYTNFPHPIYSPLAVLLFEDLSIRVSKNSDDESTRFTLWCNSTAKIIRLNGDYAIAFFSYSVCKIP